MKTVTITLNSIDKVKNFVNDITRFNSDFDLVSGRYVIDAKSIMGIFSLDLSRPITLNIHNEDEIETILEAVFVLICTARSNCSDDTGRNPFTGLCLFSYSE